MAFFEVVVARTEIKYLSFFVEASSMRSAKQMAESKDFHGLDQIHQKFDNADGYDIDFEIQSVSKCDESDVDKDRAL